MRLLIEATNRAVGVADGRIVPPAGEFDVSLRVPGELRPGLINAHDHLHRNHYGRLGRPPYDNAYQWGEDLHRNLAAEIARGRAVPRREALLCGAWKNLRAGVTTVVHHDPWEPDFDDGFPIRVARLRSAHSLGFEPHLGGIADGARPADPFSIHLAEGTDAGAAEEVRELSRRGFLTGNLVAVHVVGVDEPGITLLRESRAAVVWCPSSNHFLFGRTAPAALLAPGLDVLLGSDSLLSGLGNLLDELRFARRLGLLSDGRLAGAVGALAARRLGLPAPSLEPDAPADVIVLRRPLFEAGAEEVALVVVGGAIRVLDPALLPALGPLAGMGEVVESGGVPRWESRDGPAAVSRDGRARESRAPLVSVIIPTADREALLREAVASVQAQTFADWELIVADDGSTDGTRAWLETLDDPRIRPLYLERTGSPTLPRSRALEVARGEWVAFLDSDDRWMPDKLTRQLARLADQPAAGWCYTGYHHVDEQGAVIPPRPPRPFVARSGWILEPLLRYEVAASIGTWLVRRSLIVEAGGFDTEMDLRSDFDLAVRLAARSEAAAVDESLMLVLVHDRRTTSGRRRVVKYRANERVFQKAAAAATSGRIRRLCRRQAAVQVAGGAEALSLEGAHREALVDAARAVAGAPLSGRVWRVAVGCVLRRLGLRGSSTGGEPVY